jgi:hypothetical protein
MTFSSEQSDRASRQALEQLAAAPELPIESVVFTVGPGDKVEATATRWLEQGEPAVPIEERRVADILWTTSIAELHSVQVETNYAPTLAPTRTPAAEADPVVSAAAGR